MEYRIIVVGEQNEKQKKEIIFFPFKTDIHYVSNLQEALLQTEEEVLLVKREFDFLYLLANTPGRVYTYRQIYRVVWKEYPYGDITNIIYCMVHRLKQKLKKIEPNAQYIICSVKEVGYCLKNV